MTYPKMHKFESVPKLMNEFEHQDIGDPFIYDNFNYVNEEFDNVPPVIPRFQFYLQLNLKPIVEFCKQLKDGQSVADLRKEVIDMNDETNLNINACE